MKNHIAIMAILITTVVLAGCAVLAKPTEHAINETTATAIISEQCQPTVTILTATNICQNAPNSV